MATWSDCIVSYIDLIDIRKLINGGNSTGSRQMRKLHAFVQKATLNGLSNHQKVFAWNDSVVLVASPAGTAQFDPIMREVDDFKKKIDEHWTSYAISVKGQLFPPPSPKCANERFVYLEVSSYAFANCFEPVAQMSLRASVASAAIPVAAEIASAAWSLPRNDEHLSVYATGSFEIEKGIKAGRLKKRPWYVDSWIAKHIKPVARYSKAKIEMLPKRRERDVYVYDGPLWSEEQ